jgi:hypothetical protein
MIILFIADNYLRGTVPYGLHSFLDLCVQYILNVSLENCLYSLKMCYV